MHRMQIYCDEYLFEEIKQEALKRGESISAYIRKVLKKEIEKRKRKRIDFNEIAGMWKDRDIDFKSIRESAWNR